MTIPFVLAAIAQPGTKLSCTEFGHLNSLMINSNELVIAPELEGDISIKWTDPNTSEKIEIYRNGDELTKIPNEYGLNILSVFINGEEHISKQHIKENWWHSHIYQVKGSADNIVVKITGCDGV